MIDTKKATGMDMIPAKLVKIASHILSKPLTDAINNSLSNSIFPDNAKIASISPIDKKTDNKNSISNFRPISLLGVFSKIYEKIIKIQLSPVLETLLSPFVSAYREHFGTQHVLMRLIEEWRKNLDNNYLVGGVLMDLSKAFDCIPHDLLIAKFQAYGFNRNIVKYFYSYLKNRKQCVKINNTYSTFQNIISGVPQGSILGPFLFNLFINDLFYFIEKASVHNFADDNTLTSYAKSANILIENLQNESNLAIKWFSQNNMIVNPDKFKAIIIN